MHHRRLILIDLHSTLEKLLVIRASRVPRRFHIGFVAYREHANVDAAMRCCQQQSQEIIAGHEIGVTDVEGFLRASDREREISFGGCAAGAGNCVHQTRLHISNVGE